MESGRILVATDLSENARPAAVAGAKLAAKLQREVELIYVFDMTGYDGDKQFRMFRDEERRQNVEKRIIEWYEKTVGEPPDAVTVDAGAPDAQIRERIAEGGVGWLMIGMSGRGAWSRLVFGSTALKLSGRPPSPTAVVHPEHHRVESGMTIGCGTDFTESSDVALERAAWFARSFDSTLRIVHSTPLPSKTVIRNGELPEGMRRTAVVESARESMDTFVRRNEEVLDGLDVQSRVIADHPVAGLRSFVEDQGIDWLVLGHRRPQQRGGSKTVKGKWVQQMTCSTLLVPSG